MLSSFPLWDVLARPASCSQFPFIHVTEGAQPDGFLRTRQALALDSEVDLSLYLGPVNTEPWVLGRLRNLFWASVPSILKWGRGGGRGDKYFIGPRHTAWCSPHQTHRGWVALLAAFSATH